jgi:hypothetical protein
MPQGTYVNQVSRVGDTDNGLAEPQLALVFDADQFELTDVPDETVRGTGANVTGYTRVRLAGAGGAAPVPETRTISTTAPLTGGGDLSTNRTLAISAATSMAAGSMSAADKTKLDGITAGAAVASVGVSAPITTTGGTTPTIGINAADGMNAGSMSSAHYALVNGATDANTASTLVKRDASGNFQASDPVASSDVATRGWVETMMFVPVQKVLTFTDNAGTDIRKAAFTLTGTVEAVFYLKVTSDFGNHTNPQLVLSDGVNDVYLSASGGSTLNSAPPGSMALRTGLAASALTIAKAGQVRGLDPATAGNDVLCKEVLVAMAGGTSTVYWEFDTGDSPTSGAAILYAEYKSLGGGTLTPV